MWLVGLRLRLVVLVGLKLGLCLVSKQCSMFNPGQEVVEKDLKGLHLMENARVVCSKWLVEIDKC